MTNYFVLLILCAAFNFRMIGQTSDTLSSDSLLEIGYVCIYISGGKDYSIIPHKKRFKKSRSPSNYQLIFSFANNDKCVPFKIAPCIPGTDEVFNGNACVAIHKIYFSVESFYRKSVFCFVFDGFDYTIPFIEGYKFCSIYKMIEMGYIYVRYYNEILTEE